MDHSTVKDSWFVTVAEMTFAKYLPTIYLIPRHTRIVKSICLTLLIFGITFAYFFPILYMFLTGFKTEIEAVSPKILFTPTLTTFRKVLQNSDLFANLVNSIFQVILGTFLSLMLGVPAAFALVFGKFKKPDTADRLYFWFITTILLPPVAVLIPLYTTFQVTNLNKTPLGLLLAYVGFHIPIVVWMCHSFFKDIPPEIMEAAQIDGCTRWDQFVRIGLPLTRAGQMSAGLLVAVFIWNEFFLGFNLTTNETATLPVFMARFREQQDMFTAQLSASTTLAILPAIILGWISQKSLAKGLTLGAIKG